jgi:hypothetical protein
MCQCIGLPCRMWRARRALRPPGPLAEPQYRYRPGAKSADGFPQMLTATGSERSIAST